MIRPRTVGFDDGRELALASARVLVPPPVPRTGFLQEADTSDPINPLGQPGTSVDGAGAISEET